MSISIFAVAAAAAAQAAAPQATVNADHARAAGYAQAQAALSGSVPQVAAAAPSASAGELLTDDTIITLVRAGLGPDTVVAKINASRGSYDTSTSALIRLKQANVPDEVIAAMVNRSKSPVMANAMLDNSSPDPMAPHSPGIYLLDARGAGQMLRMDATVSNQTKTSNILGYALTAGLLSSAKVKTVIPNATARVHAADSRPVFYFFFNQSNTLASLGDFSSGFTAAASSPNEFSLIHLDKKKDHREAVIGSVAFASLKSGISDKARIAFSYDEIAPGIFKVTPSANLPAGEYGFVYSVSGSDKSARIFDFAVN
jgi:hypothetical protein